MVYPVGKLLRPIATFPIKQIEGIENLPRNQPFIVSSNHNSFFDPIILAFVIAGHTKRKIYFISAMILFFDFIANFLFSEFAGSIRIRKKVHGGFLKSALRQLHKGNIIGIFPEGMPTKKPDLRKGKTGVARLVLAARVPVVPVGIRGTLYFWSRLKWLPRPSKKIIIKIGKPLYFKKLYGRGSDYHVLRKITTVIMKRIASLVYKDYNF